MFVFGWGWTSTLMSDVTSRKFEVVVTLVGTMSSGIASVVLYVFWNLLLVGLLLVVARLYFLIGLVFSWRSVCVDLEYP